MPIELPMAPIGGHDSGAWEGGSAKDGTPDPIATGYAPGGHPELDPAKCVPTVDPWSTHCARMTELLFTAKPRGSKLVGI